VRIIFILLFAFAQQDHLKDPPIDFNQLVTQYREIGRAIGFYYPNVLYTQGPGSGISFVSYPGKPVDPIISKDSLFVVLDSCRSGLNRILNSNQYDNTIKLRAQWINSSLKAIDFSIRQTNGEVTDFDKESLQYFGIQAPKFDEQYFQNINQNLDKILPGKGSVKDRYLSLSQKFTIPRDKIDTIIKTLIAEVRRRTIYYLDLPKDESVSLGYITKVSFAGATRYLGNNRSDVLVNTEFPLNIYQAIEVICHETYPGHHVYNLLMDKHIREKDWEEMYFSPLFGPQGFMNEAIASYGREMIFSNKEMKRYSKEVLLPLAGLDTTDFDLYNKAFFIRSNVKYLNNEVSRGQMQGTLSEVEIISLGMNYGFLTKEEALYLLTNIKNYRCLTICFNYGADLIRKFINDRCQTNDEKCKWDLFNWIIDNPTTPAELKNGFNFHCTLKSP